MKKFVIILPVLLGSCSNLTFQDTLPCANDLMRAYARNASELILAAQASHQCRALAIDAMQQVIVSVMEYRNLK